MPDEQQPVNDEQPGQSQESAPAEEQAPVVTQRFGPAGEEIREVGPRERKGINRRELLKLAPLVVVGAFAIPALRDPLLMRGLEFSDWTSEKLFGRNRLAQTFSDSEV